MCKDSIGHEIPSGLACGPSSELNQKEILYKYNIRMVQANRYHQCNMKKIYQKAGSNKVIRNKFEFSHVTKAAVATFV